MAKLRDKLKSTIEWSWSGENTQDFNVIKKLIKKDTEKGIKRLTSSSFTPWSSSQIGVKVGPVSAYMKSLVPA